MMMICEVWLLVLTEVAEMWGVLGVALESWRKLSKQWHPEYFAGRCVVIL